MTLGDQKAQTLEVGDWVIIAAYFVLCLGVGLFSKFRKQRGKQETSESYFLAGRSMLWWAVGPSLFASNIGSEHFIGLAGSGAATGVGVVSYEWQACWVLLLLGWVFVPIYLRSRVFTMPEYLKKRFQSRWVRTYLTAVALISYVFTKTSVDIYAGSVFLYEAVGWNVYISAAVILLITAIYTLLGGLMAVIFTDVLQCAIMIIGAIVLAIMSFVKVGGYNELWRKYESAVGMPYKVVTNTTAMNYTANGTSTEACYKMTPYWGNMIRPLDDPDYPWLGIWTTLPIMGIWYWCTDQVIVQRALGAKNNVHAKAGSIFAGLLKILPMFIMVMPGMISRVLFPDSIACADAVSCLHYCNNKWGCTNNAYPKLVLNVLPTGLVGLMMAVMMAALMSSLSSAFNSSATIFTVDVWLIFRPSAKEREKLIVGRVVVLLLVGISLVWLPIIQGAHGSQLFVYIQTIQSYLAPPITMVFGLGILWPRLSEAGALSGLIVGFIMGMFKFIFGNIYPPPDCGQPDARPGFVKLHFMYYAIIIFGVSGIVMAVVSFFTKPVPRHQLGGLTWSTINDPPMACGAIGEEGLDVTPDPERAIANGTMPSTDGVSLQLLEVKKDQGERKDVIVTCDEVYLEVVQFSEESKLLKWAMRGFTILVLFTLVFLWIYYR
ncbi:sodium/glucose cotransporter 5 [Exaiptasia diaphana]|uniref:Sodium/glucose cotransporter 5 n=1 Tax=Exaiptasia diaphana TaxID=2652724 RepID=A0A913X2P7_EXADI|nr:sodium/glucose cotransporter 5 [Exaiptasia diaphana]KXJ15910.1 Sodium/myo-inositol cotransporter [Exaiptasia diaphana]